MSQHRNNMEIIKTIIEGIVKIIKVIKCRLTCFKSSCNTKDETNEQIDKIKKSDYSNVI